MTLPASGVLEMRDIAYEWNKSYPLSNANIDLGGMATNFNIASNPDQMNEFYGLTCVKADVSTWIDQNGTQHTGGSTASSNLLTSPEWMFVPRFIGMKSTGTTFLRIDVGSFSITYYQGSSSMDMYWYFDYIYSGIGWTNLKSLTCNSNNTFNWTSGFIQGNYTETQLKTFRLRLRYQTSGSWEGVEDFQSPSGLIIDITTVSGTGIAGNIVSNRDSWDIQALEGFSYADQLFTYIFVT